MGLKIANELKAMDPDVVTTGENATEHFIDILDGDSYWYLDRLKYDTGHKQRRCSRRRF